MHLSVFDVIFFVIHDYCRCHCRCSRFCCCCCSSLFIQFRFNYVEYYIWKFVFFSFSFSSYLLGTNHFEVVYTNFVGLAADDDSIVIKVMRKNNNFVHSRECQLRPTEYRAAVAWPPHPHSLRKSIYSLNLSKIICASVVCVWLELPSPPAHRWKPRRRRTSTKTHYFHPLSRTLRSTRRQNWNRLSNILRSSYKMCVNSLHRTKCRTFSSLFPSNWLNEIHSQTHRQRKRSFRQQIFLKFSIASTYTPSQLGETCVRSIVCRSAGSSQ